MVQQRHRDSIWRKQLLSLFRLLSAACFGFAILIWLVSRTGNGQNGTLQRELANAAVLKQERRHRLALGFAMRDSLSGSQQQAGRLALQQQLPRLPGTTDQDAQNSMHIKAASATSEALRAFEDLDASHLDPKHLTENQERLLNAALARQARESIDRIAEFKANNYARAEAYKKAKETLLLDQQVLQGFVSSPLYAAYQDTRRRHMHGRGIIIAAGGPTQLASAYATLKTLKEHLKSQLPVEIFFNGPGEMDNSTQHFFETKLADVRCIDGSRLPFPEHQRRLVPYGHAGWAFKAFALYSTSFKEVLYLDADSLPLAAPDYLFDTLGFRKHGCLFWPDYWDTNWMNPAPAYRLLNVTSPWEQDPTLLTTESGEFLLDRSRHIDALEWMLYLNMYGDVLYNLVWGDKDLYRLAFSLAGQSNHFSQVVHRPADALLRSESRKVLQYRAGALRPEVAHRHAAMIQLDPRGSMAFFHRTSDAKLDPECNYSADFHIADYISVPLTPGRATSVLGGSLILGPLGLSTKETENCTAILRQQLMLAVELCHIDVDNSRLPIPVWPLASFPETAATLNHSFQAFLNVQGLYKAGTIRLGNASSFADKATSVALHMEASQAQNSSL